MLKKHNLEIDAIRVPVKRQKTLEVDKVETLAEAMLEEGQQVPIQVRPDPAKPGEYILIEGLHRLEALKALGESTVVGVLVRSRLR